ncbi:MAG TPA: von Willebrand factor type A domain-containing protein, partial [Thermoanaerobaculia bacterium]|nr:von Willebrand factor type A domain-containing protein [Thermoanaerobaculia bacterium]
MSRWSEREIARKLAERDQLEPPAGLLEKIKSEIPPMIPAGTGLPEIDRRPSMPPRQRWLIAASVVTMIGAGLLVLHRTEVPPVEETARTAAATPSVERPAAPPPPPSPRPSPAVPRPEARAFAGRQLEPKPAPQPLSRKDEEKLKSLGYVSPEVEGSVEGGAPGGVVGGLAAGSEPAPPSTALPPPPPPPAAAPAPPVQAPALADKKESAAEAPARDEQRSNLIAGGNEDLPRSAAPMQEAAKPQMAARAKVAGAGPVWQVPSPSLIEIKPDAGTASYDLARRSIAAGRLPDPGEIRVGEILNAFDMGEAPRVEGGSTPFLHGSQYRLLRIDPAGSRPIRINFNSSMVARYRLIGSGASVLYEIELRPGASRQAPVVGILNLGSQGNAVLLS